MKRKITLVLALATVIGVLSGCSANNARNSSLPASDSKPAVSESGTESESSDVITSSTETTTTTNAPETTTEMTSASETTTATPVPETTPEPYVPEDYSPTALYDYNDERVQQALKEGYKYPTVDYREIPVIDLWSMLEPDQLENCLTTKVYYPYHIEFIADETYQDEYPPIHWNKNIPLCQLMYLSDVEIGIVYHLNDTKKVYEELYNTTDFGIKYKEGKSHTMSLGSERTWDIEGAYFCSFMRID